MIIPFCLPKARPMNISRSVSAVSRNAVLNVFPIVFVPTSPIGILLDVPPGEGMHARPPTYGLVPDMWGSARDWVVGAGALSYSASVGKYAHQVYPSVS